MNDLISRLSLKQSIVVSLILGGKKTLEQIIDEEPSVDAVPVVRCKDCKHRPKRLEEGEDKGFNLDFPDYECPCQCEDGWYNWMPDDNWFCGNGERKKE